MSVELPKIRRIEGRLHKVQATSLNMITNSFVDNCTYRFDIDGQKMRFYTAHWMWNPEPFLAEGDRVELAVLEEPFTRDGEQRIYALRNCEDDCVYVAHFLWKGDSSSYATTRIPPKSEHRYTLWLGVFLLALAGVIFCVDITTKAGSSYWIFLDSLLPGIWLLAAIPLYVMRWRWQAGFPTRRQKIMDAVYDCLGLGSPLAPDKPVLAV
ncbi:MAG: hypothetical protein ABI171_10940 [Collimonas sp.]|uniref:hypothetical protein n=1 Tax=Collimonas sp. TaxID=1963772 RepID=UPI0032673B16